MPIDTTVTPDDAPMFASIPSWERNRKRRGFGFSAPRATHTPIVVEEALDPLDAPGDTFVDQDSAAFAAAPVYANRTSSRRTTGPAMAIVAGLIAVGGLGAATFYAVQPHDNGMAELTPGAPSSTAAAPSTVAMNDAAAPAATTTHVSSAVNPARTTTTKTTTRIARAPPPASRSVDDAGVNASATLPDAPMAYTGMAVNPAPVEAAPAPTPTPVESTPAPGPVQSIPEPSVSATPETPPQ